MIKKSLYFCCLLLLANCSIPNTAFLGPVYTGAKTGNVLQTSLSYSSGKILNQIRSEELIDKKKIFIKNNPIFPDAPYSDKDPVILLAYKVKIVEISDVFEPEPLP
tara:strand:+ start:422 stop:739 length:318 start_codon:yes stop_codon:yes gene_type:complete